MVQNFENKKSIGGNFWHYASADERLSEMLMQQYHLPYVVARVLSARGVTADGAQNFLEPKLQNLLPDPSVLKGMDTAASRLAQAVIKKENVGIIGDYDVDGATSSAVLRKYLECFGLKVFVHIPEREEGYGPSLQAFDEFKKNDVRFVVTTDCGTTAFEILDQAADNGFEIVVLDHHEAETRLPKVVSVVNPKRVDQFDDYPYLKYLAAVGVVFLTVIAVNRELRRQGFFEKHPEPDLRLFLDMVALGTVCDVVPMLGLNRAFVRQGLKIISKRGNMGIKSLCDIAGLSEMPTAYHLGFVLGPRINAGGRVGDSSVGHKLLCASDKSTAEVLAEKLNTYNQTRKDIEAYVLLQAIEILEGKPQEYPIAFVYSSDWHQGVIGIVAGKLKERYHLPSFVMSIEQDEVKGSARSVPGVDLGALVIAAKESGLITKGGGHTMAAGFSLEKEQIEPFRKFAGEYIVSKIGTEAITPTLDFDAVVTLGGANFELAEKLEQLEPYGSGNPEPKIMLENVCFSKPSIIGSGHVRGFLTSGTAKSLKAIAFRAADTDLGNALLNAGSEHFDVLGTLRKDTWQNQTNVQFIIEDVMRY